MRSLRSPSLQGGEYVTALFKETPEGHRQDQGELCRVAVRGGDGVRGRRPSEEARGQRVHFFLSQRAGSDHAGEKRRQAPERRRTEERKRKDTETHRGAAEAQSQERSQRGKGQRRREERRKRGAGD